MMDDKDELMNTTRHLQARMSQRAISTFELDITLAFGEVRGDKIVLNKKRIKELIAEFEYINTNQLERAK
jgi:hypothetical protein